MISDIRPVDVKNNIAGWSLWGICDYKLNKEEADIIVKALEYYMRKDEQNERQD